MKLHPDWRRILKKAWSVKFNIASTIFGAVEVFIQFVDPTIMPGAVFLKLAVLTSIGGNVSRFLAQKEFNGD